MTEEELEAAAYRQLATVYPHECYDQDPERFWRFFHEKCPEISRAEMERLLDETRE